MNTAVEARVSLAKRRGISQSVVAEETAEREKSEGLRTRRSRSSRPEVPLSQRLIIIVEIDKSDYHFERFSQRWMEYLGKAFCPACGAVDGLKRHACYQKYYYRERIRILRVICVHCGTTHALIPCFSLPGTSAGTWEAERYLNSRAEGVGRGKAGRVFEGLGVSQKYGMQLDKMFACSIARAKVVLGQLGRPSLNRMQWVYSMVANPSRPLCGLNSLCLSHGVNAVCFCRVSILLFRPHKAGVGFSHNLGRLHRPASWIHSGAQSMRRQR